MPRKPTALALLALLLPLLGAESAQARVPRDFFGIDPQTSLSAADTNRMRGGGIDVIRYPLLWPSVQPSPDGPYNWAGYDEVLATAARSGLDVLPVLSGTPRWLSGRETNLPVSGARQRRAWTAFVRAAVERYGASGQF